MLSVVFVLLPGLVTYLFWSSNRKGREKEYQPGPGRQRWTNKLGVRSE